MNELRRNSFKEFLQWAHLLLAILLIFFSTTSIATSNCSKLLFSENSSIFPSAEILDIGVKALPSGSEALSAKIALINRAKESVDISYYTFDNDQSSQTILHALLKAIERGVHVRILVGDIRLIHKHNYYFRTLALMAEKLETKGSVQIHLLNPLLSVHNFVKKLHSLLFEGKWLFAPIAFNNRSHEKILLVDAATKNSFAIIGGRNLKDDYYGINGKEYQDYEIIVKSAGNLKGSTIAKTLTNHFDALFFHKLNFTLRHHFLFLQNFFKNYFGQHMELSYLKTINQNTIKDYFRQMETDEFWMEGFDESKAFFIEEIQNIKDRWRDRLWNRLTPSGYQVKSNIVQSFFEILKYAETKVDVVTPYPLFYKSEIHDIEKWLLKNPDATFNLHINSFWNSDSVLISGVFRFVVLPQLKKIRENPNVGNRLQIYFYTAGYDPDDNSSRRELLHLKAILVDDAVLVTSSNIDPRSRYHNSEIGLWTNSKNNRSAINKKIKDIRANSLTLELYEKAIKNEGPLINFLYKYFSYGLKTFKLDYFL